jgi:hypothetical protein
MSKKSKEPLYVVACNIGGSIWPKVYKLTWSENHDFYVNLRSDICYDPKREGRHKRIIRRGEITYFTIGDHGCIYAMFDNKRDAQIFLDGAKLFRDFMLQFFEKYD